MKRKQEFFYTFLAFLAVILTLAMVIYPEATYKGANFGLSTWTKVLIPSLLPFIIIADILVELGIVNFLGVFLEPLMRPIFKQPGAAGFVVAMGFTSGFPIGAVLTNSLYEKDLCTKEEASRLIAFTNNSSPLFLLVAVPIGMFNNPGLGVLLAVTHYGTNILLGIILGLRKKQHLKFSLTTKRESLFKKSLRELINARRKNQKPIGTLLGKAVNKAIQNILTIGGFVIFFAVLIEILRATSFYIFLTALLNKILLFVGIEQSFGEALTTGIFEMTLGARKASEVNASLVHQAMITSLIIGWSGLSIQAQVTSIAGKNAIPIGKYILGRIFQGIVACILTGILFPLFINTVPAINFASTSTFSITNWSFLLFNITSIFIVIIILLFFSILIYLYNLLKQTF